MSCELITQIWHKGNDPIRCYPIAIIDVDVDLPEIYTISLLSRYLTFHLPCWLCIVMSWLSSVT